MSDFSYSPDSLGEDLLIDDEETGGDLVQSPGFDLEFIDSESNLKASLIRRLTTPKGFLARFVQDYTGLVSVNSEYGNDAYKYLSEPLTATTISSIKEELRICLGQESRIEVADITPTIVPYYGTYQVFYSITYSVVGSDDMETLAIVQSGNALVGT